MKKILKSRIFLVILTFIISVSIGVVAANISATDVSYNGMTVQEALDNLYTNGGGATPSTIITALDVSANVRGTTINVTSTVTATDSSKIIGYHYFAIEKNNNQVVYDVVSKSNTVSFQNLKSYTKYLYYCVAYDIDNNSIKSSTNEAETEDLIIELADKYDKYVYIDSVNGDNTSGTGTKTNPYKTLAKITENGVIQSGYSYGIVLNSGNYDLTTGIFNLNSNKSINIIGNRENTILKASNIFANSNGGSLNYTINIYRLVWNAVPSGVNTIYTKTPLNLYNVAFTSDRTEFNNYFISAGSYNFYNCTLPFNSGAFLRTTQGTIKLTNCYGGFSSGYNTQQSSWDYQTNTVTASPQVDSTTYRITDVDEMWKGNGTGTNPDGSQANRGVYGGTYSWDLMDDLF